MTIFYRLVLGHLLQKMVFHFRHNICGFIRVNRITGDRKALNNKFFSSNNIFK